MQLILKNKLEYRVKSIYFDVLIASSLGDFPNDKINIGLVYLVDGNLELNASSLCINKDNLRICENISSLSEIKIRLDVNNEDWYTLRVEK